MIRSHILRSLFVCLVVLAAPASAQTPSEPGDVLKVFLDCQACDMTFLRQEIKFINYVVDRKDADLHVLVTTRQTGTGGREYTLEFIGIGRFAGKDQRLLYVSSGSDTEDERRRGFARIFLLGLTTYLVQTSAIERLSLRFADPAGGKEQTADPANDPWNFWIFRVGGSAELDGERADKSRDLSGSISANRTTEEWKIEAELDGSFNKNTFTLSDGRELVSRSHDWTAGTQVIRSLGPTNWAAAVRAELGSETFTNHERKGWLAGGIEYSFFPYSESSRRSMVLQYVIGARYFDYEERTIFGKEKETVADHALAFRLSMRQPWGSTSTVVETASYLHDFGKYRVEVDGDLNLRLVRGLNLNISGNASRVHDQLYIPAGEATDEQILLRIRRLRTSYRYGFEIGLSYQFGSIFNNIVNPRFGGG